MPELAWLLAGIFALIAIAAVAAFLSSRAAVAKERELAGERVKSAEEKSQVALREVKPSAKRYSSNPKTNRTKSAKKSKPNTASVAPSFNARSAASSKKRRP